MKDTVELDVLSALVRLQQGIAGFPDDLNEMMGYVTAHVLPLVNAQGAAIELIEHDAIVCRCASGILESSLGIRTLLRDSLSSRCIDGGAPLIATEVESEWPAIALVPLKRGTMTLGVLKCVGSHRAGFGNGDAVLLDLVAGFLTTSLLFAAHHDCERLYDLATHDNLTGLANRSHFMDRLRHAQFQHSRTHLPFAILVMDMDSLAVINERYGLRVGDAILQEYAACLRSVVRKTDTAARIGDDEFALILDPIDPVYGVEMATRRIHDEVAPPFLYDENMYLLRASVGGAYFPQDASDIDELMNVAESRMVAAKNERKQSKSIFQPLADF
jgi:diguanylate cyclase (GGDEF)-like protein